jgi:EAL domain-containing protein (putative c-di-GMP-specific phosphodiesterase class I)
MEKVDEVNKLRTSIQHWDVERREDYFVNLPDNHPLKVFVNVSPSQLAENIRQVLDHYSLKENTEANKTAQ